MRNIFGSVWLAVFPALGVACATVPETSSEDTGSAEQPLDVETGSDSATATPTRGDVNGDGSVTIVDALMVAQFTTGIIPNGSFYQVAADATCDGAITIVDALMIAQHTVGLVPGPLACQAEVDTWSGGNGNPVVAVEPLFFSSLTWLGETLTVRSDRAVRTTTQGGTASPTWGAYYGWGGIARPLVAMSTTPESYPMTFFALSSNGESKRNLFVWDRYNAREVALDFKELWGVSIIHKPSAPTSSMPWDVTSRLTVVGRDTESGEVAVAVSDDRGSTWTFDDAAPPSFLANLPVSEGSRVTSLHYAGGDPHYVWAGTDTGKLLASFDGGGSWTDCTDPGMPATAITSIHSSAGVGSPRVYVTFAAMKNNNIWMTPDGASQSTWQNLHGQGLPSHEVANASEIPYTVSANPYYPSVLYLNASFGSFISFTNGKAWIAQ